MAVIPDLASIASEQRELARRVQALESSAQLGNSSITGGALIVYDDRPPSGVIIAYLGAADHDTWGVVHGIIVGDHDENPLLIVHDAAGVVYPYQQQGWWGVPNDSQSTAAGAFTTLWEMTSELVTAIHLKLGVTVSTPAGTTAEVRLVGNGGTYATNARAVGGVGAVTTTLTAFWAHGITMSTGPIRWALQARVTSGAGPVTAFRPDPIAMSDWASLVTPGGW